MGTKYHKIGTDWQGHAAIALTFPYLAPILDVTMDIKTLQTWLPIIKDIVTILATAIAALVAISGYRTWKKQLHWKTQYELAQRMAKATYKVREALSEVRRFYITEEESYEALPKPNEGRDNFIVMADLEKSHTHETYKPSESVIQYFVYRKRWHNAQEAFIELDSVSLEAEAIWGTIVKETLRPLLKCVSDLSATITIYLDKLRHPHVPYSSEEKLRDNQIMFSVPGEKDNLFSNEIDQAVSKIEVFLKPYLKI